MAKTHSFGFARKSFEENLTKPDRPFAAYDPVRTGMAVHMRNGVQTGDAPEVVAETVVKTATAAVVPRRRYTTGRLARQVRIMRRFVPESAFDRSLRKHNHLAVRCRRNLAQACPDGFRWCVHRRRDTFLPESRPKRSKATPLMAEPIQAPFPASVPSATNGASTGWKFGPTCSAARSWPASWEGRIPPRPTSRRRRRHRGPSPRSPVANAVAATLTRSAHWRIDAERGSGLYRRNHRLRRPKNNTLRKCIA